jgi:hypothetical protein
MICQLFVRVKEQVLLVGGIASSWMRLPKVTVIRFSDQLSPTVTMSYLVSPTSSGRGSFWRMSEILPCGSSHSWCP